MDKLNELDTSGVEPMAQVLYDAGETATLRDDVERPVLGNETAAGQRPAGRRGLLQSPQGDREVAPMDIASLDDRPGAGGPAQPAGSARSNWPREALRFAEAENPKTNAYLHFCPERALGGGPARGREAGPRRGSRPAGRRAGRRQGRHPDQGRAHHGRLQAARELHSALRRHGRRCAWSRPAA